MTLVEILRRSGSAGLLSVTNTLYVMLIRLRRRSISAATLFIRNRSLAVRALYCNAERLPGPGCYLEQTLDSENGEITFRSLALMSPGYWPMLTWAVAMVWDPWYTMT